MESLGLNVSPSIPAMPIIPAPPRLPEIPSFIPTVKLELPVLPPAPKIPKLPNKIKATIELAEALWRVFCMVKKPVGFVKEKSIKARVEQMTQRTYEIPYWDNMDKTLEQRKSRSTSKIPEWISNIYPFLMANEFQNVQLKWLDIWVETFVNVQFKLDGSYDIINYLVNLANTYVATPGEWMMQEMVNKLDEGSREVEKRMNACVTRPASEECLWRLYTWELKRMKEDVDEKLQKVTNMGNNIKNGFAETKKAILLIEEQENNKATLKNKIAKSTGDIAFIEDKIEEINRNLDISAGNEDRIWLLNKELSKYQELKEKGNKIWEDQEKELEKVEKKLSELTWKYWPQIDAYERYLNAYSGLNQDYQEVKESFSEALSGALSETLKFLHNAVDSGQQILDYVQFEEVDERNDRIEENLNKMDKQQNLLKEQRYQGLEDLYKEINVSKDISYVDYDKDIYNENIKNLKEV